MSKRFSAKKMSILLTGDRGNLGAALQRQGTDHHWIGLGRDQWDELPSLLAKATVVIHAASDLVTPVGTDPRRVMDSNLNSTIWLLEELARHPVDRLVFISSCAVYGRSEITQEEVTPTPISINGITKLLNEEIIKEFCKAHKLPYQILRVFNTFGGNDKFSMLSRLTRAVQEGGSFTMFNKGVSQRDFIHVDDIAQAVLAVLAAAPKEKIINVGTGEATRIRDVVAVFKEKYPTLDIVDGGEAPEIEYSRADTAKLRRILPDYKFRDVLEFIRREL